MIKIELSTLSDALRELHERTLINLFTGDMKVPQIIAEIKEAGISQSELARQIGEPPNNICRWADGTRHISTFAKACRLVTFWHCVTHKHRSQANAEREIAVAESAQNGDG